MKKHKVDSEIVVKFLTDIYGQLNGIDETMMEGWDNYEELVNGQTESIREQIKSFELLNLVPVKPIAKSKLPHYAEKADDLYHKDNNVEYIDEVVNGYIMPVTLKHC
ncbi:hypothetical protein FW774_06010 [Pedobacter sp. BS3]|uniref:hypothetical protein n=1 Tax=Pedobacter sp. BS3 TaxID=2567937 RepID=UPI0011EDEEDB|nr:hypothetical protein [Pedobacter sp. BS3]TZF84540.1 hypothetical protein FW774_06010 [Pedobacter sp. BS3]